MPSTTATRKGSSNRPQHSRCEAYKFPIRENKQVSIHPSGLRLTYSFERIQQLETKLTTDYTNGEIRNFDLLLST